ncbi:hypothetical protein D3C76_1479930 [compost metagenome]
MDHGVDAGGGGDRRRQAEGEVGVEQRQVRQQQGRDHAELSGFAGGDDGDGCHLGAGTGGGRHLQQRQAAATDVAHAIDIRQPLLAVRVRQQRHQLGHVHRAAAAKTHHQLGTQDLPQLHGLQHH